MVNKEKIYQIEISGETINTLHHAVMNLFNLLKSHRKIIDTFLYIEYLNKIKDVLDVLTDKMEEIK